MKGPMTTMHKTKTTGGLKERYLQSNFHKEIVQLRKEMKPMTFKQKVDHIWTYYKEYIGLIALLLFVTTGLITSMFYAQERKESVVTGIMINIIIDQEGKNVLSYDYAQHLGVDEKKVKLENTDFSDLTTDLSEENYNASMIVINEVSAKMLDYMIMDKLAMEFYTSQEVYMDLREFFTLEELQQFAANDQLVFCLEEDTAAGLSQEQLYELQMRSLTAEGAEIDGCWPAAVKITDMEYVKDQILNQDDIYFALAGSTQKIEEVRGVWEYMKAYKAA